MTRFSSVAQKMIMATTGLILIGFIIAHLLGNLEIFSGRDAMNTYAAFLRTIPKALWTLRIGLLVAFVLHMATSINLAIRNRAARPVKYGYKKTVQATLASRTMLWGGLVVLSFLIFHLAHLTWGFVYPEHFALIDDKGRHDVYAMTVAGFQDPLVSAFYILAQFALAMHISHGFGSAAQTFGLTSCRWGTLLRRGGVVFAILVALLYTSIPASVWFGFVTL